MSTDDLMREQPPGRIEPEQAKKPDTEAAEAVELRESGWSNKKIARSLDVHPSTVGRWFAGAHHPDEPEQPRSEAILEGATP